MPNNHSMEWFRHRLNIQSRQDILDILNRDYPQNGAEGNERFATELWETPISGSNYKHMLVALLGEPHAQ